MTPKINNLIKALKSELSGCQKDDVDRLIKAYNEIINDLNDKLKEVRVDDMTTY